MTHTEKLIAEVLELDEKATEGPWGVDELGRIHTGPHGGFRTLTDPIVSTNAEFICRARTAAPKLAKALREAVPRLEEGCMCYRPGEPGYPKPPCSNHQALTRIEEILKGEA